MSYEGKINMNKKVEGINLLATSPLQLLYVYTRIKYLNLKLNIK